MSMSPDKKQRLEKSLKWISEHAHATNLEVPDEFLSDWMFEDDEEEQRPSGFYFTVFAFGYARRALSSPTGSNKPITIRLGQLIELFGLWQLKLALAQIHRRTDKMVEPLPLFTFPSGEEAIFLPRA